MSILQGKRIILGITGSIAAYKAAELASRLTQMGALVDAILTPAAEKFITPLTLQSVTGRRAYTEGDLWGGEAHVLHVGLGRSADLLVVAPCTANTLARLAHGEADNLLTITALAAQCPLLIAPAMDGGMLDHPATQENLAKLREHGAYIAGPAEGHLASGLSGKGRLLEAPELLGHIRLILGRNGRLSAKKVVISAGGTQEPLDPVRVLTNRSSGKQGYALAQAAVDAGADVTLITTPTALTPPVGTHTLAVQTARQMLEAVLKESASADILIMAAAVADFRPRQIAGNKMKKRDGVPQVELEATEDILEAVARQRSGGGAAAKHPCLVIGFAAESHDLLENAGEKLKVERTGLYCGKRYLVNGRGFWCGDQPGYFGISKWRTSAPAPDEQKRSGRRHYRAHRGSFGISMRILVISDIHANYTALEAVLQDAGPTDEAWCLGDLVGYGPDPNAVIEQVRELPKLCCVLGNHDVATLGKMAMEAFNHDARRSLTWTQEVLTADNMDFLGGLPQTAKVRGDVTLVHGSPRDPIWEYVLNTLSARLNFDQFETPYCFVGHSHVQCLFLRDSAKDRVTMEVTKVGEPYKLKLRAILNPGSVGQPRDRDPRAAYAIYDSLKGTWEPRRVAYDFAAVQERIREAGLPEKHAARLAEGW